MKTKSILFIILLLITSIFANNFSGEELFNKHCASCHTNIVGLNEQNGETTYITENAPYIKDVILKLKQETKTKQEFLNFIYEYINNPSKRKSLYGTKAIKEFGLMPSLKGTMDKIEANRLANYLYNGYGKSEVKQKKIKTIGKGETLFIKYCAACHTNIIGLNEQNGEITYISEKAPYIKDILKKVKEKTKTKKKFVQFINNYINHPNSKKSLFGKKAIKEYGLMPSLQGVVNEEKVNILADYLYKYEMD